MKKFVILAACLAVWACKKNSGLAPDPLPEPVVVPPPAVDTSKHNIINDWHNYQYKYTFQGNLWVSETNWKVRITKDTIKIDEGADGIIDKSYPISFQSTALENFITMTVPGTTAPIIKTYEIRPTKVGQKQGYDLINISEVDKDVYSLLK
jgi:hypothetical protein